MAARGVENHRGSAPPSGAGAAGGGKPGAVDEAESTIVYSIPEPDFMSGGYVKARCGRCRAVLSLNALVVSGDAGEPSTSVHLAFAESAIPFAAAESRVAACCRVCPTVAVMSADNRSSLHGAHPCHQYFALKCPDPAQLSQATEMWYIAAQQVLPLLWTYLMLVVAFIPAWRAAHALQPTSAPRSWCGGTPGSLATSRQSRAPPISY